MEKPATWLIPEYLPVIRPGRELWPDCGILVRGCGPAVFKVNLYERDLERKLKACEREEFPTYEELRRAGWEVN